MRFVVNLKTKARCCHMNLQFLHSSYDRIKLHTLPNEIYFLRSPHFKIQYLTTATLIFAPFAVVMMLFTTLTLLQHYVDVIMRAIASQLTSLTFVYSAVYSSSDQRKHQSSASLAFVRGIRRRPVNSPHKWPVTRKMFPFDDVIMKTLVNGSLTRYTKLWVAHAPGMPGTLSRPPTSKATAS